MDFDSNLYLTGNTPLQKQSFSFFMTISPFACYSCSVDTLQVLVLLWPFLRGKFEDVPIAGNTFECSLLPLISPFLLSNWLAEEGQIASVTLCVRQFHGLNITLLLLVQYISKGVLHTDALQCRRFQRVKESAQKLLHCCLKMCFKNTEAFQC